MNNAHANRRPFRAECGRPERVLTLRLAAVATGAVVFGLLAWPGGRAYGLAVGAAAAGFAAAMLLGSAWRVLAAVALADPARRADASWAGGAAAATAALLLACAAVTAAGGDGLRLLAAGGLALNASFVIVRLACIEAGCCRARSGLLATRGFDLRAIEIAATLVVTAAAAALWVGVGPAPAASLAFAGHLGVRLASRRARADWPARWLSAEGVFCEIAPLATAAAAALLARGAPQPG